MSGDILARPFASLWADRPDTYRGKMTRRAISRAGARTVADLIEIAPDFWGAAGAEIMLVLVAHGLCREPAALDLSPYATSLGWRVQHALFRAGIYTLRELSGRSALDLLRRENKGLGPDAVAEIRAMLAPYGLCLLDEETPDTQENTEGSR